MNKTIQEAKNYLFRIRKYIWVSVVIFILAIAAGFYTAQVYPDQIKGYLEETQSFFSSMQSPTLWGTFLMILQNNIEAMLLVVCLGIFAGIFSLTFLLANGFILGVFAYLFYSKGMLGVFLLGIIPHGIIEIPCLIFSAAIGFWIGKTVVRKIFRKKESLTFELSEGIKFAVLFIVPALVAAAFIETYITPYFIAIAQNNWSLGNPLLF